MTRTLRSLAEGLARQTSRRSFFGHGADIAFGALAGVAAGTLSRAGGAIAGPGTVCIFPGPPCQCDKCQHNAVCAKPCIILTTYYAAGCWADTSTGTTLTCCDCDCQGIGGVGTCGCGTDYHNNPANCP